MITLENLTKVYGQGPDAVTVLDRLNVDVANGEIRAIVGPSGSGKTTLAHCISLLERPTSGSITVNGEELSGLSERKLRLARRRIGTVFQSASLLSRKTAADNVALPLTLLGVTPAEVKSRVGELLERVGLSHRANHFPHQLSGGQQQRVGIARALALRPSVLLSDEATSGLDPDTTRSVVSLLRELRDDLGLAIVFVTHEMDTVLHAADSAALLDHGRIVEQGPLSTLLRDPASALGRALQPHLPAASTSSDEQVWQVIFASATVRGDWLQELSSQVPGGANLLSASIQTVGGGTTGSATLGFRAPEETIRRALHSVGLEPVNQHVVERSATLQTDQTHPDTAAPGLQLDEADLSLLDRTPLAPSEARA